MSKKNICAVCHKELPSDANYCPYCGNDNLYIQKPNKQITRFDKIVIVGLSILLVLCVLAAFLKFGLPKSTSTTGCPNNSGNSASNYSSKQCRFAESEEFAVLSHPMNNQLFVYDKTTSDYSSLSLYGTNLSIYNDIIYFISDENTSIGAYHLSDGSYTEKSVGDFFPGYKVQSIDKLFVSNYGLTIACKVINDDGSVLSAFVQRDQLDMVTIDPIFYTGYIVLCFSQVIVYTDGTYDTPTMHFVDLNTYEKESIVYPAEIEYLYSGNDRRLYAYLQNNDIAIGDEYGNGYSISLNDEESHSLYIFENYLFYTSSDGLMRYNIKTKQSSLFIANVFPEDICFTSDGYMIMTGQKSSNDGCFFGYSSVEENTLKVIE